MGRPFIHCDVGINSMQTVRDRLKEAGANFQMLEVQDGVSLFRNPQQTMDKLATLIQGLQRGVEGISDFWFGSVTDILRLVKFAENEAGIILKFKHKTRHAKDRLYRKSH